MGWMLLFACAVAHCASSTNGGCTPGATASCACLGGSTGVQTCSADRTFGTCNCPAPPTDASLADAPSDAPPRCVPGMSIACACTDGESGAQTCRSDGTFAACSCTQSVDSGMDAAPVDVMDVSLDMADTPSAIDTTDVAACLHSFCGASCVDLASDPAHCGSCGNACPIDPNGMATCMSSQCALACNAGYTLVSGACISGGPPPPRAVAPLSTSIVSTHQPTLRWIDPSGVDGAHVQVCADPACLRIETEFDAPGTRAMVPTELARGVHFWRLEGRSGTTTGGVASPVWEFWVQTENAVQSISYGSVVDIDRDGHADLVVGTLPDSTQGFFVYYGTNMGLPSAPDAEVMAPMGVVGFGRSLHVAGDVNGDGFGDVVVGTMTGGFVVYYGSGSGIETTPTVVPQPSGFSGGFGFGLYAAGAGDLDGDGYGDVVTRGPGDQNSGTIVAFAGSAAGVDPATFTTITGGSTFGESLAGNGDLNGDGLADVAVQTVQDNTIGGVGSVTVLFGGTSMLDATRRIVIASPTGAMSFGASLAIDGDVDGDGFSDLVVGAASMGGTSTDGAAFVYVGAPGTAFPLVPTYSLAAPDPGGTFGWSVSFVGDGSNAGRDPIAIGAPTTATNAGRAYVYTQSAFSGLGLTSTLYAPTFGGYFGWMIAGAGDRSGDGSFDVVVSALNVDSSAGAVYVFPIWGPSLVTTPTQTFMGTAANESFGFAVQ